MEYIENPQLKLAQEFIKFTNKNLFLTGKAGTGKTTFLKYLKSLSIKRMIVTAPTGVAAINAGGVTLHSFFQLPFSPFVPKVYNAEEEKEGQDKFKLSRKKINIIRTLDLLVIDEISMVRADLLDAVDYVLRKYRQNDKPFGGVQLLMIGDLHQLAPVVKKEDWQLLYEYYKSPYFFDSNALKQSDFTTIELKHIYRQTDKLFIELLGEIRENKISDKSVNLLNSRYVPNFIDEENDEYITLTTHNNKALDINTTKLSNLNSSEQIFYAKVENEFPDYMFPTEEKLRFKIGAQVMFVKNDLSYEKLYYNGKIGKITRFDDDIIFVKCEDRKEEIQVEIATWENIRYSINSKTNQIEEEIIGRFQQYPLKLAWAITIHKSQGLTFEKSIIDIGKAFAAGQIYVALSRCKTLEGIILTSKFPKNLVKLDSHIKRFDNDVQKNEPDIDMLEQSKFAYRQELIFELFNFAELRKHFYKLKKIVYENKSKFEQDFSEYFLKMEEISEKEIFQVNNKFRVQLSRIIKDEDILQERIEKASSYYLNKLNIIFLKEFSKFYFETDNQDLQKKFMLALEQFEFTLMQKIELFTNFMSGFNIQTYLSVITNFSLNFTPKINKKIAYNHFNDMTSEQKALYDNLNNWRSRIASDNDIAIYMVLPKKTMFQIIKDMPSSSKELAAISGIGKVKLEKYGQQIIEMVDQFRIY